MVGFMVGKPANATKTSHLGMVSQQQTCWCHGDCADGNPTLPDIRCIVMTIGSFFGDFHSG